ncbi:thioesterase [Hoylesella loescheii]|uniref:thioesterase n=1 Tax=Hoylesella loescheii TaxID=840 RepID=UPI0026F03655|nr:thioesterase [Hoylesella loescheii]
MLSGMLFQLNWNTVPTYLEQESNLVVPKREFIKFTPSAYRVGDERWCLETGRMSWWW